MLSSIQNGTHCNKCTFAPFCKRAKQPDLSSKEYRILKRNEVLCLSKNKFQNLFVIQCGAIKTYQVEADGRELIRGFYFEDEAIGFEAIYTGHYLSSAVALSETVVCELPYEKILEILSTKPILQKRFLHLISQQLSVGTYLASINAEQRLAAFLIDVAQRLHPLEFKLEFTLPMSRQDIGNYLRLTAETVSRVFSRLQKNNIIAIDNKKVHFLNLESLKQISDGLFSVLNTM